MRGGAGRGGAIRIEANRVEARQGEATLRGGASSRAWWANMGIMKLFFKDADAIYMGSFVYDEVWADRSNFAWNVKSGLRVGLFGLPYIVGEPNRGTPLNMVRQEEGQINTPKYFLGMVQKYNLMFWGLLANEGHVTLV